MAYLKSARHSNIYDGWRDRCLVGQSPRRVFTSGGLAPKDGSNMLVVPAEEEDGSGNDQLGALSNRWADSYCNEGGGRDR